MEAVLTSNSLAAILSFVERVESVTEEIDGLSGDRKEIYAEAKASGLDAKILRKLIQRRAASYADVQEADALLELYEEAVQKAEKAQTAKSQAEGT